MRRVLAVYFSQSGQLERIVHSILGPVEKTSDIQVSYYRLQPATPYPFPWSFFRFFDVFPEAVFLDPPKMQAIPISSSEGYDLIVLAWQPWFLSPSLPVTGFLRSDFAKKLLNGKPVITVVGCRNMWLEAHKQVTMLLSNCGAKIIDNIVLTDPGPTWATFISTPYWMLTGRQTFPGLPKAGISEQQIQAASRFGRAIIRGLRDGRVREGKTLLQGLGAVEVNPFLIASEKIGKRSFRIWGLLLRKLGPQGRRLRLVFVAFYVCLLIVMIILILPFTVIFRACLYPFQKNKLLALKRSLEEPSGSDRSQIDWQEEGV